MVHAGRNAEDDGWVMVVVGNGAPLRPVIGDPARGTSVAGLCPLRGLPMACTAVGGGA